MTLAGTRPPLIGEVSEYELHHRARLAIKPGITGMWQVSGRSDITDFEEVVELDKEYIENWNKNQKGDWIHSGYASAMKEFRKSFKYNIQRLSEEYQLTFSKEIPEEY